jgi:hypothetical protein
VAEIRRENARQVVLVSFNRDANPVSTGDATPKFTLQREVIWQQDAPVLDFALWPAEANVGTGADSTATSVATPTAAATAVAVPVMAGRLAILEAEKLVVYESVQGAWRLNATVPIAHSKTWPRDLRGEIDAAAGRAHLPGVSCVGDFAHPDTVKCEEAKVTPKDDSSGADLAAAEVPGFEGVEAVRLGSACGRDSLLLASGGGDWTQPDKLQIFESASGHATPVGAALNFPGPILALRLAADRKTVRAISKNLATGRYEAANVSLSCNP